MATNASALDRSHCPACGDTAVVAHAREHVCRSCNTVVDDAPLDRRPEWSTHDDKTRRDPQRADPVAPWRTGKHLGSEMGFHADRDGTDERRARLHRQAKTPSKRARNERYAFGELERIGAALDIPDHVVIDAKRLFRAVHADGLEGYDLDAITAACCYTACRVHQRGRVPSEIAAYARTDERAIERRHLWVCDRTDTNPDPPNYERRLRIVANEAEIDADARERALTRLRSLPPETVYAGAPSTLAAALVWDAATVTQDVVCDAAGCSPVALRQRLRAVEDAERPDAGQTELTAWS